MKQSQKIGIGIGIGCAVVAAIYFSKKADAASEPLAPVIYDCPHCSASFDTYDELLEHIQIAHPTGRIPLQIDWG